MSVVRSQYKYDLSKLTEFDHALIYGFEPEAPIKQIAASDGGSLVATLVHGVNQHEDMFNTYMYAQDTILKFIRENGRQQITGPLIITWIKEINRRIAATLAEDYSKPELAGNYTPTQVIRWHQTGVMMNLMTLNFLKNITREEFVAGVKEADLDIETADNFMQILRRVSTDQRIEIPEYEKVNLARLQQSVAFPMMMATTKLTAVYHQNRFTKADKATIDKVVKICRPYIEMPALMNAFAEKLATAWKQCDEKDIDQIAELCRFEFYEKTDIHPFFNGNGRGATCLMNIILRSFGESSILMRNPGDRNNEGSSYSQAIALIDTQPNLLREHIKSRILLARERKIYRDELAMQVIQLRIDFAHILFAFKNEFKTFDTEAFFNEKMIESQNQLIFLLMQQGIMRNPSNDQIGAILFSLITPAFVEKLAALRKAKPAVAASSVVQRQYSPEEKQSILNKLKALTGLEDGWKMYAKDGLTILLETESIDMSKALVAALNPFKTAKLTATTITATKQPVIRFEAINIDRLEAVTELTGWNKLEKAPVAAEKI